MATATWLAPENTPLTYDDPTQIIRLRWEISDENDLTGGGTTTNTYQLRMGLPSQGTPMMIPVTTTSNPFRLVNSPNLTDEAPITGDLLSNCSATSPLTGRVIESNGNRSMTFQNNIDQVLENEWVIQANGAVLGTTYRF